MTIQTPGAELDGGRDVPDGPWPELPHLEFRTEVLPEMLDAGFNGPFVVEPA